MFRFHHQVKLISQVSFFYISLVSPHVQSAKNAKPLQMISAQFQISGDLKGSLQFGGALGSDLQGQSSDLTLPCTFKAHFRPANYQKKKMIETTLSFTCPSKRQGLESFSPPRFFLDQKSATNEFDFLMLSQEFKKIHVQVTEIKITQKQVK